MSMIVVLAIFIGLQARANAAIVLTDFTTALAEVGTAVTNALGSTVTAGLAISGVVLGGMLLWKLFRRISGA